MTPREVLVKARALISDPERWCQYHYAVDSAGVMLGDYTSPDAERWCSYAAIMLNGQPHWQSSGDAIDRLHNVVGCSISHFNDTHTHAEVLAAFDKAIAEAA